MNKKHLGIILVLLSAVFYGLMPLLSKYAYMEGISVNTVLFMRFLISSIILWSYIGIRKLNYKLDRKHLGFVIVLAVLGYSIPSLTLFTAYKLIPSYLATIILFAHPIFVVIMEVIIYKSKISNSKYIAMTLALSGLILALYSKESDYNILGIILSVIAAVTYGIYCLGLYEKRTKASNSIVITSYVLSISCLFNFVIIILTRDSSIFLLNLKSMISITSLAIFATILASLCFYTGLKRVGPGSATIISSFEPIFVALLGIVLLKETLTSAFVIGSLLVIVSIILIQRK